MNRKKSFMLALTILTSAYFVFAQNTGQMQDIGLLQDEDSDTIGLDVALARSSPDYMVTPGDVYTLTFALGGRVVSHILVVGTDYRIRVANLAVVNGRGQTFMQVRNRIEAIVQNNHPMSGPQLILTQPAIFRVFVNGEVYSAGERFAWGLTKLSSLVDGSLTGLASIRDVTVRSSNGQTQVFDLFRFWRHGDQSQNPHLRPGDVVTFNRVNRRVSIQGEVERSGTYQLLAGENLRDLVRLYGNGLTPHADLSRITLTRFVGSGEISGDILLLSEEDIENNFALEHLDVISIPNITYFRPAVPVERVERSISIYGAVRRSGTFQLMQHENLRELIEIYGDGLSPLADPTRIEVVRRINSEDASGNRLFLTLDDLQGNFALEHLDLVHVPAIADLMPVMFVEGAVGIGGISADLVTTNRLTVQFHTGETYAAMVRRNRGWFSAVSDTENAYVIRRNGEIVPLNINYALFDATYRGEVLVQDADTLVIPFRQFFVTVAGAVQIPGRFPFIPDRGWEYYVGLAGGFVPGRNARDSIVITDADGRRLRPGEPITPETVITARANHPMFFLSQYIVPVLSLLTTMLTVALLVR